MDVHLTELLQELKEDWIEDELLPRYHQAYKLLKRRILDGKIAKDTRLPTEIELAKLFNISRITAKRALDELSRDNLIRRYRGRGSYVIHQYRAQELQAPLVPMMSRLASMSRDTVIEVLDIHQTLPPKRELDNFPPECRTQKMHRVRRLRSTREGMAFAHYETWTPNIKKGFTKSNLEKRMRIDLIRANGVEIHRVEQYLGAEQANPRLAAMLGMENGDPLLTLHRYSYDDSAQLVDVLYARYNPRRFNYHMRLTNEMIDNET